MNKNCNVGDRVWITFDDHSEGDQHIVFDVPGTVISKDRRSIVIATWMYHGSMTLDENTVTYTILRSAIQHIEIVRAAPTKPRKPRTPKTQDADTTI